MDAKISEEKYFCTTNHCLRFQIYKPHPATSHNQSNCSMWHAWNWTTRKPICSYSFLRGKTNFNIHNNDNDSDGDNNKKTRTVAIVSITSILHIFIQQLLCCVFQNEDRRQGQYINANDRLSKYRSIIILL